MRSRLVLWGRSLGDWVVNDEDAVVVAATFAGLCAFVWLVVG